MNMNVNMNTPKHTHEHEYDIYEVSEHVHIHHKHEHEYDQYNFLELLSSVTFFVGQNKGTVKANCKILEGANNEEELHILWGQ
jgi:hypothetical protein